MRRFGAAALVLLMLPGCGDDDAETTTSASQERPTSTATAPPPTTTTTTLPPGAVAVVATEGSVEMAVPGMVLAPGDALGTGEDGSAVLVTGDGTRLVLLPGSRLLLGTDRPTLEEGETVAVGQSDFEIATPDFAVGIRGSGIALTYRDGDDDADASCLFGDCYVTVDGEEVGLPASEWLDLSAGGAVGETVAFEAEHRRIWAEALGWLRAAGHGVDECACDQRSLRCAGVTEIPFFPACPDDTTCACEGPDLACEDGRVFEDDQECMEALPALADLLEFPFTATYDCVEARSRWLVFDPTLMLGEHVLRAGDTERQGCQIMTWLPETLTLTGVGEDGALIGSTAFTGSEPSDVSGYEEPGKGFYHFGPRFPSEIAFDAWSHTGETVTTTADAYVLTPAGEATITVAGVTVAATLYSGTFTEREVWESEAGVQAVAEITGTHQIWVEMVTGLELREEEEAYYSACNNCDPGLVGTLEHHYVVQLASTSHRFTSAG